MARYQADIARGFWRPPPLPVGSRLAEDVAPEGVTVNRDAWLRQAPEGMGIVVGNGVALNLSVCIAQVTALTPTFTAWRVGEYVAAIPGGGFANAPGAIAMAAQWGMVLPDDVKNGRVQGIPTAPLAWALWVPVRLSADDPRALDIPPPGAVPPPGVAPPPPRPGIDITSLIYLTSQQQAAADERRRQRAQDERDARRQEQADRLADLDYQERLEAAEERRRLRRQTARK